MGKFLNLETDIFQIFNSAGWKSEGIRTIPSNFIPNDLGDEYIRITIIPQGAGDQVSTSGILMIDIFTPSGKGPHPATIIADKLDTFCLGKTISTVSGNATQFLSSSIVKENLIETIQLYTGQFIV